MSSIEAPALSGRRAKWSRSTVGAYIALTKPRIIELLLVTTLPTMVVAQRGVPPIWLMAATLAGGALAAGGANAINMVVDRDIDRLMNRTKNRPLVTGAMTPAAALVFALALGWQPSWSCGWWSTCFRPCWPSRRRSSTSSSTRCG
jgi:protoheme IX farnesyltransferase